MFALEFPPINEILRWTDVVPSVNKIALIAIAAVVVASVVFLLAGNADGSTAPRGVRNLAESIVEFIEGQIIMPTMGRDGLGWTPFLMSLFSFIYLCNVPGVIPIIQMPATARMAIPLFLSLLVWVIFIGVGFKHQGIGYLKNSLFPPGVPAALYLLVTPIEFLSTFLVRPFSHAVRLFANMLAGHILLITFGVLCISVWSASALVLIQIGTFPGLVAFTAFEVGVSLIQAFVFTILAAVYIGGALHPAH